MPCRRAACIAMSAASADDARTSSQARGAQTERPRRLRAGDGGEQLLGPHALGDPLAPVDRDDVAQVPAQPDAWIGRATAAATASRQSSAASPMPVSPTSSRARVKAGSISRTASETAATSLLMRLSRSPRPVRSSCTVGMVSARSSTCSRSSARIRSPSVATSRTPTPPTTACTTAASTSPATGPARSAVEPPSTATLTIAPSSGGTASAAPADASRVANAASASPRRDATSDAERARRLAGARDRQHRGRIGAVGHPVTRSR